MHDRADDWCPLNACAWSPVAPGDAEYEHFGWCPACGGSHGHLNIGPVHWYHCDRHQTKWRVGENLFGQWRQENEETWGRNARHLADYRDVGETSHTPTAAMLERLANTRGDPDAGTRRLI